MSLEEDCKHRHASGTHSLSNPRVAGSNPAGPTTDLNPSPSTIDLARIGRFHVLSTSDPLIRWEVTDAEHPGLILRRFFDLDKALEYAARLNREDHPGIAYTYICPVCDGKYHDCLLCEDTWRTTWDKYAEFFHLIAPVPKREFSQPSPEEISDSVMRALQLSAGCYR